MASEPFSRGDLVLQIAGAGAGIAVFVTVAGGAVTAARLHALGVPVDSTIAVLPQQQILASGVTLLARGLAASVLPLFLLWLLQRRSLGPMVASARVLLVVLISGLLPLLIYTMREPLTKEMRVVVIGTTLLAAAVLVLVMRSQTSRAERPRNLVTSGSLFVVLAVFGAILAFARAYSPPVWLDFADVQLKDGGRTNGFLLGYSAEVVVLAPDVLDRTIGRTVAIQRDQIVNLKISRVSRPVRPISAQPVSSLRVEGVADPDERDLQEALLGIRLSAQWKYPPVIYRGSVRTWRRRFLHATDTAHSLPSSHAQDASLADLNEQTTLFIGRLVRTTGIVLAATPKVSNSPQRIVFRDPRNARFLATCDVAPPKRRAIKARQPVRVIGLVIASGVFVSGGGTERNRVVMFCLPQTPA